MPFNYSSVFLLRCNAHGLSPFYIADKRCKYDHISSIQENRHFRPAGVAEKRTILRKKLKYSILNIAFDILSWYSICKSFLRMVFYPQGVVWKLAFYKINIRNEWSS